MTPPKRHYFIRPMMSGEDSQFPALHPISMEKYGK